MNHPSHKYNLLKKLYDASLKLTATDFSHISNANQYFVELEQQGLITSEWGKKGESRVKLRFITAEQKERVERYLKIMGHSKDEVQES